MARGEQTKALRANTWGFCWFKYSHATGISVENNNSRYICWHMFQKKLNAAMSRVRMVGNLSIKKQQKRWNCGIVIFVNWRQTHNFIWVWRKVAREHEKNTHTSRSTSDWDYLDTIKTFFILVQRAKRRDDGNLNIYVSAHDSNKSYFFGLIYVWNIQNFPYILSLSSSCCCSVWCSKSEWRLIDSNLSKKKPQVSFSS